MYRALCWSVLRYSPRLVRVIDPELANSEKCFILLVTKEEPWSSRQPLQIKIRSKWIKYDITVERKLNSSAHDKGGFIIHRHPGCATTRDGWDTPSLEGKFNTPGICSNIARKAYFSFANKGAAFLFAASPQSLHLTELKSMKGRKFLATPRENSVVASSSIYICFYEENSIQGYN